MANYIDNSEKAIMAKCSKKDNCTLLESMLWYENPNSDQYPCLVTIRSDHYELEFVTGTTVFVNTNYCSYCGNCLSNQSNFSDNLANIPKI